MKYTGNHNSSTNQEIKRKFVEREVLCCITLLVDDLLKKDMNLEVYDEIENLYVYNVDGETYTQESLDLKICELEDELCECKDDEECKAQDIEDKIDEFKRAESEPQEILEWWAVTKWLMEKLREHGEPVLDYGCTHIWGRTCSGQAILLDGVISDICEEMEILEGQAHDWSKR